METRAKRYFRVDSNRTGAWKHCWLCHLFGALCEYHTHLIRINAEGGLGYGDMAPGCDSVNQAVGFDKNNIQTLGFL